MFYVKENDLVEKNNLTLRHWGGEKFSFSVTQVSTLECTFQVGDLGSIPGLGRSPGEGKGYPLQYSGLENSMDCTVYGVTKSWTKLKWLSLHFIHKNCNFFKIKSHIYV